MDKSKILITGATGFIGKALAKDLSGTYDVVGLTRDAERGAGLLGSAARVVQWDGIAADSLAIEVEGSFGIINLAGQNIASGRWTKTLKGKILESRLNATRAIVKAVREAERKPQVLIQASAIGYYGSRDDEWLDENSDGGEGFPASVCKEVEEAARAVEDLSVRLVILRTGVVLGKEGGALPRFAVPFRFYLGGYVGEAGQWLSWISLGDEIRAIRFLLENENCKGVFNLVSPEAVTNKEFAATLGEVLGKPSWTRIPKTAVRLALGEMGREILLGSQHVIPRRLTEAGFEFRHVNLQSALRDIYK